MTKNDFGASSRLCPNTAPPPPHDSRYCLTPFAGHEKSFFPFPFLPSLLPRFTGVFSLPPDNLVCIQAPGTLYEQMGRGAPATFLYPCPKKTQKFLRGKI